MFYFFSQNKKKLFFCTLFLLFLHIFCSMLFFDFSTKKPIYFWRQLSLSLSLGLVSQVREYFSLLHFLGLVSFSSTSALIFHSFSFFSPISDTFSLQTSRFFLQSILISSNSPSSSDINHLDLQAIERRLSDFDWIAQLI